MASFGRSARMGPNDDLDRLQTSYQEFHDDESDDESSAPPQFHTAYQTVNSPAGDRPFNKHSAHSRPTLYNPKTTTPFGDGYGQNRKNYNGINNEDSPGGGNVIIHQVPEENKSRWSHIEDLDSFFKKVYEYHQRHGFSVMILQVIFRHFFGKSVASGYLQAGIGTKVIHLVFFAEMFRPYSSRICCGIDHICV